MVWGGTFLIVKNAIHGNGSVGFVATRFGIAALIAAGLFYRKLRGLSLKEALVGLSIGASIFAGYSLQTYGLNFISSSKSAFITGFYVPLVPLLQWLFFRRATPWATWAATVLAFIGVALLAGPDGLSGGLGKGELLTALGALAIAAEILLISILGKGLDTARVTVVQLACTSLIAWACVPLAGEGAPLPTTAFIAGAAALGCASCLIQFVMNWAQQRISATKATLIYAGEPIWAGVVGAAAGERITGAAVAGALLIIGAGILTELRLPRVLTLQHFAERVNKWRLKKL